MELYDQSLCPCTIISHRRLLLYCAIECMAQSQASPFRLKFSPGSASLAVSHTEMWLNIWIYLYCPTTFKATLISPLRDQDNGQEAQWSPKHIGCCFRVTAPSTFMPPLKNLSIYGLRGPTIHKGGQKEGKTIATVAQGLLWLVNGGTMVTTVIIQHTLLVTEKRQRGSRNEEEASPRWRDRFLQKDTLLCAYHWPTIVHLFCNLSNASAILLSHLSDQLPRLPFCNCLNIFNTSQPLWRPWRCWSILFTTYEWPRQPSGLLWASNGNLASFMVTREAQRSEAMCKGV